MSNPSINNSYNASYGDVRPRAGTARGVVLGQTKVTGQNPSQPRPQPQPQPQPQPPLDHLSGKHRNVAASNGPQKAFLPNPFTDAPRSESPVTPRSGELSRTSSTSKLNLSTSHGRINNSPNQGEGSEDSEDQQDIGITQGEDEESDSEEMLPVHIIRDKNRMSYQMDMLDFLRSTPPSAQSPQTSKRSQNMVKSGSASSIPSKKSKKTLPDFGIGKLSELAGRFGSGKTSARINEGQRSSLPKQNSSQNIPLSARSTVDTTGERDTKTEEHDNQLKKQTSRTEVHEDPIEEEDDGDDMDFSDFLKMDPEEVRNKERDKTRQNQPIQPQTQTATGRKQPSRKEVRKASEAPLNTNISSNSSQSQVETIVEPPNPIDIEFEQDEELKGLTLDRLVHKMNEESIITQKLIWEVLITYRSFTTPEVFLNKLFEKFKASSGVANQLRVIKIIQQWVEKLPHDFNKDKELLLPIYDQFINHAKSTQSSLMDTIESIKTKVLRDSDNNNIKELPSYPLMYTLPEGESIKFRDINSIELARQITLQEKILFDKIRLWECLNEAWTKDNKNDIAPNICSFIQRFNYISGWVKTEICSELRTKSRTSLIAKFLDVAEQLYNMGNFNGLFEIMSALNSSAVHRLRKSFSYLSSKHQLLLNKFLDYVDSVPKTRLLISSQTPPCIPYLGMMLTDIFFIETGNKDNVDGLINFRKRHLLARTIDQIYQFQQQPYNFQPYPKLQDWINCRDVIVDDKVLFTFSLYIEPKPNKPVPEIPKELEDIVNKKNIAALKKKKTVAGSKFSGIARRLISNNEDDRGLSTGGYLSFLEQQEISLVSRYQTRIDNVSSVFDAYDQNINDLSSNLSSLYKELNLFTRSIDVISRDFNRLRVSTLSELTEQRDVSLEEIKLLRAEFKNQMTKKDKEIAELQAQLARYTTFSSSPSGVSPPLLNDVDTTNSQLEADDSEERSRPPSGKSNPVPTSRSGRALQIGENRKTSEDELTLKPSNQQT
eukprot:TRINITY_DN938_c0_g3_i2.p1 TRINITY_DN938_c0_g3~~TRINITY_DN938_c0_g3_i2.p1  ORF type:complete len:999 (-),score=200.13 TRINITY_DN938_c0_g3_i2:36-3032(-)